MTDVVCVGVPRNALEIAICDREGKPLKQVDVYARWEDRPIWLARFELTKDDIRKLADGLAAAAK